MTHIELLEEGPCCFLSLLLLLLLGLLLFVFASCCEEEYKRAEPRSSSRTALRRHCGGPSTAMAGTSRGNKVINYSAIIRAGGRAGSGALIHVCGREGVRGGDGRRGLVERGTSEPANSSSSSSFAVKWSVYKTSRKGWLDPVGMRWDQCVLCSLRAPCVCLISPCQCGGRRGDKGMSTD